MIFRDSHQGSSSDEAKTVAVAGTVSSHLFLRRLRAFGWIWHLVLDACAASGCRDFNGPVPRSLLMKVRGNYGTPAAASMDFSKPQDGWKFFVVLLFTHMPLTRLRFFAAALLLLAISAALLRADDALQKFIFEKAEMGLPFRVSVY